MTVPKPLNIGIHAAQSYLTNEALLLLRIRNTTNF